MQFAYGHAGEIRGTVAAADAHVLTGDSLPLRARMHRGTPFEILVGAVEETRHPYTGLRMLRRLDVRRPETMADLSTFEGTDYERVPRAYFVPAGLTAVLDRLEAQGVRTSLLAQPLTIEVERFRIDSTWTAERPFQNHRERTVLGGYERAQETLPAGTVVVRVDQPLGRLAFYLLEPRSDDGLLDWNLLDGALANARSYPIVRTFAAP